MTTGLIVALDDPDLATSENMAKQLADVVDAFKVGLTLFNAHGPEAVLEIGQHGRVFLDQKLHDIPHQVESSARVVSELGVWMFTVHASGGAGMVSAAAAGAGKGPDAPIVAAVTVLTSLDSTGLQEVGQPRDTEAQATRLARLASLNGAGAIVCSPHEIRSIRLSVGRDTLIVVPGIRPAGFDAEDQRRIGTPAQAAAAGADHVVVGRVVTRADDPVAAVLKIKKELGG